MQISEADFESKVLKSEKPVVVDFYADWCGPCRMLAPIFEELEKEMGDKVGFVKLNVDEARTTAQKYGVMSIPMVVIFKGGEPAAQMVGARPKDSLKSWIEENL